ncbi:MAG: sensor histidine kinase [Flavobacteriaceae bacterium]|nr:sensor histidine kinase [Flavobacteriaceae bacterium]
MAVKRIVAFSLLMLAFSLSAQKLDFEHLVSMPNDTARVNRLNEYAKKTFSHDSKASTKANALAIESAKKLHYNYGLSVAYDLKAALFFYQMDLDSSKIYIDKAYHLIANENDGNSRILLGNLNVKYAAIYQQRQLYDSAIQKYLTAIDLIRPFDETKLIMPYYNISGIYNFLDEPDKALYYARETRLIALKTKDTAFLVRSLIALGEAYVNKKDFDSIPTIAEKGMQLATYKNDWFAIGKFHYLSGSYFASTPGHSVAALDHLKKALEIFRQINIPYDVTLTLQKIGNTYYQSGDFQNAVSYLTEAADMARKNELDQILQLCLNDLAISEQQLGNINAGFNYLREYITVNDAVTKRNNRKITETLESKYQSEKKEKQIALQNEQLQKREKAIYILGISLASLLLTGFFYYLYYRQKQLVQQQQINQLETERQLTATASIIKGEEQERSRLAKDLHDGLGGMLSGIKHSLNNMKGNLIMTPENALAFERSIDMLDSSINEMRRVAHNMMPEALVKFGLDMALSDFCAEIGRQTELKITYQSYGLEPIEIMDQSKSITVYRIVQELVNNALKHSGAKEIVVQLSLTDHILSITVEDDGKGFDTRILENNKGIGWGNIKNRVEFLKGTIDINSARNKGTSVLIEINV